MNNTFLSKLDLTPFWLSLQSLEMKIDNIKDSEKEEFFCSRINQNSNTKICEHFSIQRNQVWSESFQKGSKERTQICIRNVWFLSQDKQNTMVADSKSKSDLSFGKTFASSAFSACFAEVITNTIWVFLFFIFCFWGFFLFPWSYERCILYVNGMQ